jgi:hypothetical protein
LRVSSNLAIAGIDTREILVISKARFEDTFLGAVWGIIGTTNAIIYVFAEVCSVGTSRITSLKTKLLAAHEIVPLYDLLISVVIFAPSGRKHKTTQRVSSSISAVRIQFSSTITRLDVDLALIDEPHNLDVIRGPHKLYSLQCTGGDGAGSPARLSAPRDFLTFGIGNERVRFGRGPEAEIICGIEERSLAKRGRAFRCRIAQVVSELCTTQEIVLVGLVRDASRVGKTFAG